MSSKPNIRFVKDDPDATIPKMETPGSAGADLSAVLRNEEGGIYKHGIQISPGCRHLFSTGLRMEIPVGFEVQIRPRSGLALKHGITVLNTPGTIDADFRGVVSAILINHGREPFVVTHKMRIAQMVVAPVCGFTAEEVDDISATARGAGGFGSTGTAV
jgi:dUTP pyrophosphatase